MVSNLTVFQVGRDGQNLEFTSMEWSRVGFLLVTVILLSYGGLIESFESPLNRCLNPQVFLSYLDLERYNTTNPYIDFDNVVNAMLDFINGRKQFSDSIHDIATCWFEVCRAKNPEKEIAAWKDLAKEIHHRLHSDESVLKISKMIFGDRMVPWIMSPPKAIYMADSHIEDCVYRLNYIFVEHCGVWNSFGLKYLENFSAMCSLGVRDDEFAKAAEETCRGYVYTLNPLLY